MTWLQNRDAGGCGIVKAIGAALETVEGKERVVFLALTSDVKAASATEDQQCCTTVAWWERPSLWHGVSGGGWHVLHEAV